MSFTTLIVLTIVEIVLLVAVLAVFLILLTQRLRSVAATLSQVAWGVRAVEVEVKSLGPSVREVNQLLQDLTGNVMPGILREVGSLTRTGRP